ncbi:hypothetical protein [Opitutus sp. GAS368]|uniref:hypothetical protein n=1 Tax=Opitutus sp. GAS368 TaxID=1882749 RepID=UPI000879EA19|nr:hypothetical protein [Opitutus sp. GAS368]SDR75290.1 hypothetical protein SAMN05444173_0732 [Opitutus sp. GAS368]
MHSWKFFRTGELDQVSLETGADLLNLEQLDPKLWVALSCPVKGLELDEKTLAMIDTDGDGHIRVPELLAAIKWASARLREPGDLLKGADALPLAAINDATPEGKIILASAKQVLANLGKRSAAAIAAADASDTAKIFSASPLNGDGVIPPEATEDPEAQALIKDIIACFGGASDRTGSVGVTAEKVDAFFTELAAYAAWVGQSSAKDIAILGDATDAACAALKAVRAKAEDYYGRCRLAAFDSRATAALNRAESEYLAIAAKDLKITAEEVAGFPLARIEAGRPLPLVEGVNPAWAGALATLQQAVVKPIYGAEKKMLTAEEWAALNAKFSAYETWLGGKAGSAVEKLGLPRVKAVLAGQGRAVLADLLARDKALEPEFKAITDVDRLTHYYRDLRALLHNFVNFADFYSRDKWAVFQAGTLYLDSRSTELCIQVTGPSPLAAMGKIYIAYVDCKRTGGAAMKVAACFTQGDSDYLFVGRNGVFYDRQGRDWDAVITSLVDNPISLRQAFWSPYKKFVRLIDEMVAKRAAAADAAANDRLGKVADKAVDAAANAAAQSAVAATQPVPPPPPPKKLDVGVVAALGVAVGAIGGALATVSAKLAELHWWQLPLVLVAVMLAISLPAVIIAWLKLRQRTLGPILESNGWAINGRVKINIPFGSALTELARKPAGSKLSLDDPYEDKEAAARRRRFALLAVLVALIAGAIWIRYNRVQQGHYFWEPAPVEAPVTAAPAR